MQRRILGFRFLRKRQVNQVSLVLEYSTPWTGSSEIFEKTRITPRDGLICLLVFGNGIQEKFTSSFLFERPRGGNRELFCAPMRLHGNWPDCEVFRVISRRVALLRPIKTLPGAVSKKHQLQLRRRESIGHYHRSALIRRGLGEGEMGQRNARRCISTRRHQSRHAACRWASSMTVASLLPPMSGRLD